MMERTKIGTSLYNLTVKWGEFINKNMWLYYLLNYTWGIIMTLIGWAIIFFTHLFLSKNIMESGKFCPCHYVMIGDNWGGLELGINFLIADNAIFTGYNSSNEPLNNYEKLVRLFGGEGIELHGKVIVNGEVKDTKYLDLHGGGINTDNIAYWKGDNNSPLALVAINLDQFVGLTIADSVCLPK